MSAPIGYIGLGSLGSAIFSSIIAYSSSNNLPHPKAWNRTQTAYPEWKAANQDAEYVETVEDAIKGSETIFTCLVNDQAALEVYQRIAESELKGKIFADQSTLKPSTASKIKELVEEAGGTYLTTCVFGQPAAARARQLVVVSSGNEEGRNKVLPILEFIGKKVIDVGDDNAKGASLKILGNSIILGAIQLYSESYALSDAIGFDPAVFHELHKNVFAAPALLNYSNKISQGAFGDAGFTVKTGLKDAGHMLSLGEEMGHPVALPTIERAKASLLKAVELGAESLDWSAASAAARLEAGLEPFREGTDGGKKRAQT